MAQNAVDGKELRRAVDTIIAAVETQPAPAASEFEFVRLAVNFANTGTIEGALRHVPGLRYLPHPHGEPFLLMTDEIAALLVALKKDLAAVVRNELPAPTISRLKRDAKHTVLVPSYEVERGELHVRFQHLPQNLTAALAYAALLIYDSKRAFRTDLKRCRLAQCAIFFFASDRKGEHGGRPRYAYCCDEHMDAGQTPGAERTAKWRKNKAKQAR